GGQAALADARAERVGDRLHAGPLRGLPREDDLLRARVEYEILRAIAVDAPLDDHLVVDEPEGHGVPPGGGLVVHLDRYLALERLEESHLRARPRRLLAAVAVRQQVDVVHVRVGGLVEPVHALVDLADRMMDLGIARRGSRCGERLVERFLEPVPRGYRPGVAEVRAR